MTPHPPDHEPDYTLRRSGDKLIRYCWTCAKASKRRWAAKNREKVLRTRRASAKRNTESRRIYQQQYRAKVAARRKKWRESFADYRKRNPDRISAIRRRTRLKHIDKIRAADVEYQRRRRAAAKEVA